MRIPSDFHLVKLNLSRAWALGKPQYSDFKGH